MRASSLRASMGPLACFLAIVLLTPAASAQETLPINQRRLSDRVLLTWACDHFQGTNMAVVTTADGLVVIDTGLSPTLVGRQRALVERELGRHDFRYVVNTHAHNDHAFANQVFPEAVVVGPEVGVRALAREVERIPELVERLRAGRASYGEWAAETSPDSVEGRQAREGVAAFDLGIGDLEAGIDPRAPTLTFRDRHALEVGGVRFELFEFVGLHSEADILVLLPGERMVFTGDAFWGGQLPILHTGSRPELERLLSQWAAVLAEAPDLERAVPGHSDVPLTVEQFRGMYAYLSRLWDEVRAEKAAGRSILEFLMRTDFAARYPEVADFNRRVGEYNAHQHNVSAMWAMAEAGASGSSAP